MGAKTKFSGVFTYLVYALASFYLIVNKMLNFVVAGI